MVINHYTNNVGVDTPELHEPTSKPLLIPHSLLHDVLLIESRSFALRYAAEQKKKMLSTIADLNKRIDEKANSIEDEDIEEVFCLKHEVQNLEEERDMAIARKKFTQLQLEGERPMRFFCKMNKKIGAKAQFETLHVEDIDKGGRKVIRIIHDQTNIEWEVRKYYYNLYSEKETRVDKDEILQNIEKVTKIDNKDASRLECKITEGEVAVTLLNTKNNVAPGPGGFGGDSTRCSGSTLSGL